ncbi:Cysteine protease, C1A family [Lachnospiraceae bacterium XBB1006]|nr:Cysteine protease, C1A family [Lachnospiraceae bacterium XBB1006]
MVKYSWIFIRIFQIEEERRLRILRKTVAGCMLMALLVTGISVSAEAQEQTLPERFSWKEQGMVTPVKCQSPYNACWAFSATACMEQNILIKGGGVQDLSEAQLGYGIFTNPQKAIPGLEGDRVIYNHNEKPWYTYGGNNIFTLNLLARGVGPVLESEAPYTSVVSGAPEDIIFGRRDYDVKAIYTFSGSDRKGLKEAIMQYGGVTMPIHMENSQGNQGEEAATYVSEKAILDSKEAEKEIKPDHEVCVVGWDDGYSRVNFGKEKPKNDGAWLCKNSYGTSWGEEGFFWLSYEDAIANAESTTCYAFEMANAKAETDIYQYDGGGSIDSLSVTAAANVFTARRTEKITEVRVRNMNDFAKAEIAIYTDVEEDPESGELAMQMDASFSRAGYETIELNEPVTVGKGQRFSVCIYFSQKSSIGIDRDASYKSVNTAFEIAANPGESYCKISEDGGWSDLNGEGKEKRNLRIKALAEPFTLECPESFVVGQKAGVAVLRWHKVKDATGYRIYRRNSAGKYVCIATVGNVKTYKDRNVKRGGTYYYRIKAEAGELQSVVSTYRKIKIS